MPDTPNTVRPAPLRDEAPGYRPVASIAVAALAVTAVAAAWVIIIWIAARMRGRPILAWPALLVAAVGLGLAITARWQLRRAEGTRTGHGLARAATWLGVLSLGAYGAYFAATDLAVRQQAEAVADKFFGYLVNGQPELAFRLTRSPAQQQGIPEDPAQIRARFGSADLFAFESTDLVRVFRSWPDKTRVEFSGEKSREDQPDGFAVALNYVLRDPEGRFGAAVVTRGTDDPATGGREWQVLAGATRLKDEERQLTLLGRLSIELQHECRRYLRDRWLPGFQKATDAKRAAVLRLEGNVIPEAERLKVAAAVGQPGAIDLVPGSSPLRPPALPTMVFTPDAVLMRLTIEANAGPIGANVPAVATVRVEGADLVRDMLRMAGPNWEAEPLVTGEYSSPELARYVAGATKVDDLLKVAEINLRPSLPRIASSGPIGRPGP
jgi:hypothetical protein